MKTAVAAILIALSASLVSAQGISAEQDFQKERRSLSLVRFSVGEDASSGFYYLVYKKGAQIKKIRSVWDGGCCNAPTVEDFYFKNGSPVLYVKLAATRRQLNRIVRGSTLPLSAEEKLQFRDSGLTMWIEKGKAVSSSDPRWKDREKSLLEEFQGQLDNYKSYQEERK
jgi:hypothetical protein